MLIFRWVVSTLAILLASYLVPGVEVTNFWAALLTALVLGLINAIIRPLVILLTLPANILTLGLFTLIINAFMLWLAAYLVPGFDVQGFWPAFAGALIFWAVGWLSNAFIHNPKE
ncbi:phage holin family protein [Patescibacteria group bacterium]|nr:phage holin family protein [Patescibacteria group bacterium]